MRFSLIVRHVLSKICHMTKNIPFFSNFARFCTPKRCARVHCLVLKNNPNYVNFFTRMISNFKYKWPPRALKKWGGGWLPLASPRLEMVVVLPLAVPNKTLYVLRYIFEIHDWKFHLYNMLERCNDIHLTNIYNSCLAYIMTFETCSWCSMGLLSPKSCTWMCLLDLENPTFSIPILNLISYPSVYHFRKKMTQFCPNWVLFTIFCLKYNQFLNFGSFVSDENPPIAIPNFEKKKNLKGRHIYVYQVNVRTPPPMYSISIGTLVHDESDLSWKISFQGFIGFCFCFCLFVGGCVCVCVCGGVWGCVWVGM